MQGAALRYRVMAYTTGVMLIVLIFIGVPLQMAGYPKVADEVGLIHGVLYTIYIVVSYLLARKLRLNALITALLLLAGTVPILTFIVERWIHNKFIAPALAAAGSPAQQPVGR